MMLAAGPIPGAGTTPIGSASGSKATGHVDLGTGLHACVCQAFVRLEGRILVSAL